MNLSKTNDMSYRIASLDSSRSKLDAIMNHRFTMADFLKFEIVLIMLIALAINSGISVGPATYAIDLLNLVLFVAGFKLIARNSCGTSSYDAPVIVFVVYCVFSAVVNLVTPQWALWEALNFGRLFIWVYLFRAYWTPSDAEGVMDFLYGLQVVNALFVSYQCLVLGLVQDNIGGMFGTEVGCNAPLNVYLCLVCAWGVSGYLSRRKKLMPLMLTVISAFLIAGVGELKIFYLEFVVIFLGAIVYARMSRKTMITIAAIAAVAAIGLYFFAQINPRHFEILTNFDELMEYADTSDLASSGYGVSRVHPFSQLSAQFFSNDTTQCLFGMGFGNASQSSISFFTSDFFRAHGYINYHYLVSALLFLQIGYVGVVVYLMPFLLFAGTLFVKRKALARIDCGHSACFAFVMTVLLFANILYNNTVHAYLAVFWSIPIAIGLFALSSLEANKKGTECRGRERGADA